ncbi:hypothetical protein CLIB1444_07S03994 [[Candida] jaroonii]|uniref:Uncharacterized protein n=1 Tax=[Candida] jaroonii TaxID=467808 RepID=A0ACA9YAY4_9ASCO|nr:hypothetical protein CLIB1444_07S03994 [[Candida] jaroonii]
MGKTRNRVSLVCSFCKKRKIKCNKGQPCSTCIKYGNLDCKYEINLTKDKLDYIKELNQLKVKLHQLNNKENIRISKKLVNPYIFHETSNPNNESSTHPLQRFHISDKMDLNNVILGKNKNDKIDLFQLNRNINSFYFVKNYRRKYMESLSYYYLCSNDEHVSLIFQYLINLKHLHNFNLYVAENEDQAFFEKKSNLLQSRFETINLNEIQFMLPNLDSILKIVDIFFERYYCIWPFLDEVDFKTKLKTLISPEGIILINDVLDYANLGILLLLLKMVNSFENFMIIDSRNQYLDIALNIYNQKFNIISDNNLTVCQLLLFIEICIIVLPMEGSSENDLKHVQSSLIAICNHMGFHLEPNNFQEILKNAKQNNLQRKIWYFVVYLEILLFLTHGRPFTIQLNSFNVDIPRYEEGIENVVDVDIEKKAMAFYNGFKEIWFPMIEISYRLSDMVNTSINFDSLISILEDIEVNFIKSFKLDNWENVHHQNVITFITVFNFLISIYYNIFIYLEDKKSFELAFFYLKKIWILILNIFVPFVKDYIANAPPMSKHHFTPVVSKVLSKLTVIKNGLLIRFKRHLMSSFQQKYAILIGLIVKFDDLLNSCFLSFPDYFYAWKLLRGEKVLMKFILQDSTYSLVSKENKRMSNFRFNDDMVDELVSIFSHFNPIIIPEPRDNMNSNGAFTKEFEIFWTKVSNQTPHSIDGPHSGNKHANNANDQGISKPDDYLDELFSIDNVFDFSKSFNPMH